MHSVRKCTPRSRVYTLSVNVVYFVVYFGSSHSDSLTLLQVHLSLQVIRTGSPPSLMHDNPTNQKHPQYIGHVTVHFCTVSLHSIVKAYLASQLVPVILVKWLNFSKCGKKDLDMYT